MSPSVRKDLNRDQIDERVRSDTDTALQELCVRPFDNYTGQKIPHLTVSSGSFDIYSSISSYFFLAQKGYEHTLNDLVQLTTNMVHEHVTEEASIVSAMAQRVNPNVKVDASIK